MWRPTAQDTGPTVITDFENDLSAWSGDTANYTLATTAPIYHGAQALELASSSWYHLRSLPGDGLGYYPSSGDIFDVRTHLQGSTAAEVFVCWGLQQDAWTAPCYGFRIDAGDDRIRLQKCSSAGGTFSTLAETSVTLTNYESEWLRAAINWGTDGVMTGTLFDAAGTQLAQASATDTDYTSGGVAIETNDRNTNVFPRLDYWVVP